MKNQYFQGFALVVFMFAGVVVYGQAVQTPVPSPTPDDDIVKISTKLVQLDVIVVDKKGQQVRDLKPGDFEVFQDGKVQKVTNLTYVGRRLDAQVPVEKPKGAGSSTIFPPPIKLEPKDVGRVITFVVYGVGSMFGRAAVRDGIEKFVREQMRPNDLVSIQAGDAMQVFTNDRKKLLNSVAEFRRMPRLIAPIDEGFNSGASQGESEEEKRIREKREARSNDERFIGLIGAVNSAVAQLRQFQGRKIVFVLCEGLSLRDPNGIALDRIKALRAVTDMANRSGVVINTINAKGVTNPSMIDISTYVPVRTDIKATDKIIDAQWMGERVSAEGLVVMAADTGGRYNLGRNYLDGPIAETLEIETGYYLLGYEPDENSFKGRKYNKIKVNVKPPGLKVITRPGYLTEPDPELFSGDLFDKFANAETPWSTKGLSIHLTALPQASEAGKPFIRTLLHISGDSLQFTDEDGTKKSVLDVIAVTVNAESKIVDQFNRTHTLRFDPVTAERVKKLGLVYTADVPVTKTGHYNFFVIVRDTLSKVRGSASEVISVSDIKNSELQVSNLIVTSVDEKGNFERPTTATAESAFSIPTTTGVPAIRRFGRGSAVAYAYTIYNARLDKTTSQPKLSVQVNLYKDGKLLAEGTPQNAGLEPQTNWTRINDFAYMQLAKDTEPGDYALQIIVKDMLGGKNAVSSQWVDFEVVD